MRSTVGLDPDPVVDRVLKSPHTAKIFFGRLHGDVAEQKLDLVQFTSGIATEAGRGPTKVVRRQVLDGCSLGAVLHDIPHRSFRYAGSPSLACAANAPKYAAFAHACRNEPGIDSALDPIRNGHGPNVSTLADQVDDGPMTLAPLKMSDHKFGCLLPAQPAAQEDPEQRPISLAIESVGVKAPPRAPLPGRR